MCRQGIYCAKHQRVIGRNNGVINLIFVSEGDNGINICRRNRHTGGIVLHTAVTRQGKNFCYGGVLGNRANDCVLSAAATNDHYFHRECSFTRKSGIFRTAR